MNWLAAQRGSGALRCIRKELVRAWAFSFQSGGVFGLGAAQG
jgi:hypothetical protein